MAKNKSRNKVKFTKILVINNSKRKVEVKFAIESNQFTSKYLN